MRVVGSGFSGLIGDALASQITQKFELIQLVRKSSGQEKSFEGRTCALWQPPDLGVWTAQIDGAHAVINLSGESIVARRWTLAQKKRLKESRINSTKALVDAMRQAKKKPSVFISASAIGYYGPRDASPLSESAENGTGFLAELCREWEDEALRARDLGVRTVLLRTGIVLAKNGGALEKMLPPFKLGMGGPLGSGKQCMSWIHLDDEVGAIIKILEDASIHGPVNLTAPHPVSMREFAGSLGRALKRPACFPVPGAILNVIMGEMAQMLLTGQCAVPEVLQRSGYIFKYPTIGSALEDLV